MKIGELWGQMQEMADKEIGGKYISFKGRITRRQYCVHAAALGMFASAALIVLLLAFFIVPIVKGPSLGALTFIFIAMVVVCLFGAFWTLTITVRRLHDTGQHGTFLIAVAFAYLLFMIIFTSVGYFWVARDMGTPSWSMVFALRVVSAGFDLAMGVVSWCIFYRRGNIGTNKFGPDPLPADVQETEPTGEAWEEVKKLFFFYWKNMKTIYWTSEGRLNRKQYFYCTIGLFVLQLGVSALLSVVIGIVQVGTFTKYAPNIMLIFFAWMQICTTIRRFHDHGLSGWNTLWCIVPFIQVMVGLKLTAMTGERGNNEYGVDTITAGESDDF